MAIWNAAASASPATRVMTVGELAAATGVDGHLAGLLGDPAFDLWIVDGERPERLDRAARDGETEGVRLARPGL